MAVPKKKTTPSKRGMRRSHHALGKINIVIDKANGEFRLPHHISLKDGTYNDRDVVIAKDNGDSDEE